MDVEFEAFVGFLREAHLVDFIGGEKNPFLLCSPRPRQGKTEPDGRVHFFFFVMMLSRIRSCTCWTVSLTLSAMGRSATFMSCENPSSRRKSWPVLISASLKYLGLRLGSLPDSFNDVSARMTDFSTSSSSEA